jgi:hypothetical protein
MTTRQTAIGMKWHSAELRQLANIQQDKARSWERRAVYIIDNQFFKGEVHVCLINPYYGQPILWRDDPATENQLAAIKAESGIEVLCWGGLLEWLLARFQALETMPDQQPTETDAAKRYRLALTAILMEAEQAQEDGQPLDPAMVYQRCLHGLHGTQETFNQAYSRIRQK